MFAHYLWLDDGVAYIVETASDVRENSVARLDFRVEARKAPALNGVAIHIARRKRRHRCLPVTTSHTSQGVGIRAGASG
jgi:hypothetical protein